MKLNKAAMFGLDARIALAIFGALSVISGAALYSAIKTARVQAVASDMSEIAKAFEAYFLDVGAGMVLTDTANYDSAQLVSSNKAGWKGPYVPYSISTHFNTDARYTNKFLNYNKLPTGIIFFSKLKNLPFSTSSGPSTDPTVCPSDDDCSIYVTLEEVGSNNISKMVDKIDEIIDKGDGLTSGNFRAFIKTGKVDNYYFLRIMKLSHYN